MSQSWTIPAGTYTGTQHSGVVAILAGETTYEIDAPVGTGFNNPANVVTLTAELSHDGGITFPDQAFQVVVAGDPNGPATLSTVGGIPQGANYPTHARFTAVIQGSITLTDVMTATLT